MRSDAQRIAAYIAKYAPTQVGLKVAEQLTNMYAGYAALANDLQPIEAQVLGVLNAQSIVPARRGLYYGFARELWKLTKTTADPALTAAAQLVTNKWESYGGASATLIAIALDVFAITVT